MTKKKRTILIVGGGTGGHVIPGLAIAKVLNNRGWRIHWVGNPKKIEGKLVPNYKIEFSPLDFQGIRHKWSLILLIFPFFLVKALLKSWKIFSKVRPSIVICMGGYITFPVGLIAAIRRVTLILHEQNAILGRANRYLAKFAKYLFTAFPDVYPTANNIGNPLNMKISSNLEIEERYNLRRSNPINLLILGGSQGAKILNTIIPLTIALLKKHERPKIMHQSGFGYSKNLKENYEKFGVCADCVDFIDDMESAMKSADLVICRSGAMTVSEIAAVGVAALCIPFPNSMDNHQIANARFLSQRKAAWVQEQDKLNPEWLANWLKERSRSELKIMALNAKGQSRENAAIRIADVCDQIFSNNES